MQLNNLSLAAKNKLLVFASGAGTLFESIVKACRNQVLPATVVGLVSDRHQALVLKKAQYYKVPVKVFRLKDYDSFDQWDEALCADCCQKNPDWIIMAGFLKKIGPRVLSAFSKRIVNIHPSLLPHHGGKGMYGIRVHQSVLDRGDKKTGISVHLVSDEYDAGPILDRKEIMVSSGDTAESLQKKVKEQEQIFYVSVLKKIFQEDYK